MELLKVQKEPFMNEVWINPQRIQKVEVVQDECLEIQLIEDTHVYVAPFMTLQEMQNLINEEPLKRVRIENGKTNSDS